MSGLDIHSLAHSAKKQSDSDCASGDQPNLMAQKLFREASVFGKGAVTGAIDSGREELLNDPMACLMQSVMALGAAGAGAMISELPWTVSMAVIAGSAYVLLQHVDPNSKQNQKRNHTLGCVWSGVWNSKPEANLDYYAGTVNRTIGKEAFSLALTTASALGSWHFVRRQLPEDPMLLESSDLVGRLRSTGRTSLPRLMRLESETRPDYLTGLRNYHSQAEPSVSLSFQPTAEGHTIFSGGDGRRLLLTRGGGIFNETSAGWQKSTTSLERVRLTDWRGQQWRVNNGVLEGRQEPDGAWQANETGN